MRLSVLALLFAAQLTSQTTDLPGYIPADAKVVIGLQVRGILDSLAQGLGADIKARSSSFLAETPLAGFDLMKDLDEVVVATSGAGEKPPALAILRGRFDVQKFSANAARYGGVPIFESKPSEMFAVLDASTALAGDPAQVRAAIDRRGAGTNSWVGRVAPLRGKYTVWGIGEGIEKMAPGTAPVSGLESIDRFQFGAQFSQGLDLTAEIHMRSAEEAEKLTSSLKFLQAMMKSNPSAPSGAKFDMQSQKGGLRISLHVPEAELKKTVASQRAALEKAVLSQLPADIAAQLAPQNGPMVSRPVASSESKVVSNAEGDTMTVTLPGAKR
jgi:hypothetical protein